MTVTVFGHLILISIDFYDLISPKFTSKFVKNTPLRVVFSTLFSVFGNVVKHGLSCLIYYFIHLKIARKKYLFRAELSRVGHYR